MFVHSKKHHLLLARGFPERICRFHLIFLSIFPHPSPLWWPSELQGFAWLQAGRCCQDPGIYLEYSCLVPLTRKDQNDVEILSENIFFERTFTKRPNRRIWWFNGRATRWCFSWRCIIRWVLKYFWLAFAEPYFELKQFFYIKTFSNWFAFILLVPSQPSVSTSWMIFHASHFHQRRQSCKGKEVLRLNKIIFK